jgi:hypothetical protein
MGKAFKKGSRVEIVSGENGVGVCGEIFWMGESRYGEGQRFGMRGDDGETYWVDEAEVELTSKAPPAADSGPTFNKGDRVSFRNNGQQGTGTVFWIGQSRTGPGQRLGIRDDDGEGNDAVWIDARFARPLDAAGFSKAS